MTRKAKKARTQPRTAAHELPPPERNAAHQALERQTAGYQDLAALDHRERRSDEVRLLAERIRRWAGFSIADMAWIRDNATWLAERIHCDAQGGFPAGGRAEVHGDDRDRDGSKPGPTPTRAQRLHDAVTAAGQDFIGLLRKARRAAHEAKDAHKPLKAMHADIARAAAETRRQTLDPGECDNCGATIYPAEAVEIDEAKERFPEAPDDDDELCFACRMYRARTGTDRPLPPAATEATG